MQVSPQKSRGGDPIDAHVKIGDAIGLVDALDALVILGGVQGYQPCREGIDLYNCAARILTGCRCSETLV